LAADDDERVDAGLREDLPHPLDSAVLERVGAARADDRAAELADAADVVPRQRCVVLVEDALPAVAKAHEVESVNLHSREHDTADDCVEARGIAAARENA